MFCPFDFLTVLGGFTISFLQARCSLVPTSEVTATAAAGLERKEAKRKRADTASPSGPHDLATRTETKKARSLRSQQSFAKFSGYQYLNSGLLAPQA